MSNQERVFHVGLIALVSFVALISGVIGLTVVLTACSVIIQSPRLEVTRSHSLNWHSLKLFGHSSSGHPVLAGAITLLLSSSLSHSVWFQAEMER